MRGGKWLQEASRVVDVEARGVTEEDSGFIHNTLGRREGMLLDTMIVRVGGARAKDAGSDCALERSKTTYHYSSSYYYYSSISTRTEQLLQLIKLMNKSLFAHAPQQSVPSCCPSGSPTRLPTHARTHAPAYAPTKARRP